MVLSLFGMGCSSSCDDFSDGPQTVGELGNGVFTFDCVSLTDAACTWTLGSGDTVGQQDSFPGCLAINGEFGLAYTLTDEDALDNQIDIPSLFIEPASEAYVQRTNPFRAVQEGRVAMVVRADDQIVDFIHFSVIEPDALDLREANGASVTTVEMATGEIRFIRVTPRSSRCATVGGSLPLTATSADPSIVTATTSGVLELQGQGLGSTTVTVELGLQQVEVQVVIDEIGPDPTTDTDTGTSTTFSGFPLDATATASDTDTDTDTDTQGTGGDTDTDGSGTTGGAT